MLILASASPRRHDLLTAAGIEHVVQPTRMPEVAQEGESPQDLVKRLARVKAEAAVRTEQDVVLGADTLVSLDTLIFGKPEDEEDAHRMLRLLSGKEHMVLTGICLVNNQQCIQDVATTAVRFADLSEAEISEYTRSGEPVDKAGAYAIQGLASKFVLSINGSYDNVVGLPVSLVYRYLKAMF